MIIYCATEKEICQKLRYILNNFNLVKEISHFFEIVENP